MFGEEVTKEVIEGHAKRKYSDMDCEVVFSCRVGG
jgi:hypothetical protein